MKTVTLSKREFAIILLLTILAGYIAGFMLGSDAVRTTIKETNIIDLPKIKHNLIVLNKQMDKIFGEAKDDYDISEVGD
ncbi:MAG: hypothetical protein GY797_33580 [Deltaproteobacteria bacterium]|nr:hypothetical protein [Deltaproteobacteria bacterium]